MNDTKCCFTGHRPNKLPWGYKEYGNKYEKIRNELESKIIDAINEGYNYFITGMALGIDMLAGEIVLELKSSYPFIKLECAIPCETQTLRWLDESKEKYDNIISKADKITILSKFYFNGCMQARNKYMVDNSKKMIAIFDGSDGGTKQTIEYAISQNKDIVYIRP